MRSKGCPSKPQDDDTAQRKQRLTRFSPLFRDRIAALTCCAPEAEDLVDSFPGLLVALVSNVGTPRQRARAFETILNGGSLKQAAEILAPCRSTNVSKGRKYNMPSGIMRNLVFP